MRMWWDPSPSMPLITKARDEHTISSVLPRATLSASTVAVGLAGGGPSGLFHFGNCGHAGFYARYEGDGRRNSPYDPRMLLKVLVYAYASGVFSSRKIARKLEADVAFRVLGAGNFPDHRTVNRFRQEHLEEFAGIFGQVVKPAWEKASKTPSVAKIAGFTELLLWLSVATAAVLIPYVD